MDEKAEFQNINTQNNEIEKLSCQKLEMAESEIEEESEGAQWAMDKIQGQFQEMMKLTPENEERDCPSNEGSEYISVLRIGGRPILPPLMTPEKRLQCKYWKGQALKVEKELARKKKEKAVEAIKAIKIEKAGASLQSPSVEEWEKRETDFDDYDSDSFCGGVTESSTGSAERSRSEVVDERARSAFKSLIEKLKKDGQKNVKPTQYDSTLSVNTVIENPEYSRDNILSGESDASSPIEEVIQNEEQELNEIEFIQEQIEESSEDDDDGESDDTVTPEKDDEDHEKDNVETRSRSGSYTIEKPSPLLLAYMKRFGDNLDETDMSTSNRNTPMKSPRTMYLPSPSEMKGNKEEHLQNYLEQLAAPPVKLSLLPDDPSKQSPKRIQPTIGSDSQTETLTKIDEPTFPMSPILNRPQISRSPPPPSQPAFIAPPPGTAQSQYPEDTPRGSTAMGTEDDLVSSLPYESIAESVTITLPKTISTIADHPTQKAVTDLANLKPMTERKESVQEPVTLTESETIKSDASFKSGKDLIESAITSLAQRQKQELQTLIEQQTRQREEMSRMFELQQKKLVQEILSQIKTSTQDSEPEPKIPESPKVPSKSNLPSSEKFTSKPNLPSRSPMNSSNILDESEHPPLLFVEDYSEPVAPRAPSPVIPTIAYLQQRDSESRKEVRTPEVALSDDMHKIYCKVTAMGRGFLTRRLLKTEKVQSLIATMREAMFCALDVQREVKSKPGMAVLQEDIELHRRFLQQLNKASNDMHHIFFDLSVSKQMEIIRLNRENNLRKSERTGERNNERRISAVTLAKLKQKQQMQTLQLKEQEKQRFSPKRRRVTRSHERPASRNKSKEAHKGFRASHGVRRNLFNSPNSSSSMLGAMNRRSSATKAVYSSNNSSRSNTPTKKNRKQQRQSSKRIVISQQQITRSPDSKKPWK